MKILSNKRYKLLTFMEKEYIKIYKELEEVKIQNSTYKTDVMQLVNKVNELTVKLNLKEKQRRQNASKVGALTKQLNELKKTKDVKKKQKCND